VFIRVKLEEKLTFFVLKRREKRFKCAAVCPGEGREEEGERRRGTNEHTHTYKLHQSYRRDSHRLVRTRVHARLQRSDVQYIALSDV